MTDTSTVELSKLSLSRRNSLKAAILAGLALEIAQIPGSERVFNASGKEIKTFNLLPSDLQVNPWENGNIIFSNGVVFLNQESLSFYPHKILLSPDKKFAVIKSGPNPQQFESGGKTMALGPNDLYLIFSVENKIYTLPIAKSSPEFDSVDTIHFTPDSKSVIFSQGQSRQTSQKGMRIVEYDLQISYSKILWKTERHHTAYSSALSEKGDQFVFAAKDYQNRKIGGQIYLLQRFRPFGIFPVEATIRKLSSKDMNNAWGPTFLPNERSLICFANTGYLIDVD